MGLIIAVPCMWIVFAVCSPILADMEGLEVGGSEERPDWPKLGPSLLIAACLILAIRIAKRPAVFNASFSDIDLDENIGFSIHLARRMLSALMRHDSAMFPRRKEPWYQPDGQDEQK